MKARELMKVAKCAVCGRGIGHSAIPLFYRLRIERYGIDMRAVQRYDGLAAFVGSAALADVLGPDEEVTQNMMDPAVEITVCEECSMKPVVIAELAMPE